MAEIWAKRLLPGSIRGIPFFIDSHTLKGGRHAIGHEPVDRDTTSSEDSGIKSKGFSINCHVLGDNYFFIRDAIIDAMDNRAVAVLVHPYLGIKEVRPQQYILTEDTTQGRIATFTLDFIEAGDPSFPISAIDAITSLVTQVVTTVAQVQNAFQLAYKISELPGFAVAGAVSLVKSFVTNTKNGLKNVRVIPEQQASILKKLNDVNDSADSLVQNPASLAAVIEDIISDLSGVVAEQTETDTIDSSSGRDEKLDIFSSSTDFDSGYLSIPENTPTRIAERNNAKAIQDLIRQIGLSNVVQEIASKDFSSNSEAINIRNNASEKISAELLTSTDDDSFQALQDLNSSMVLAIPNPNDALTDVKTINVFTESPSIVLAYDLYEKIDNESDIINRNQIRNPGFIIGDIEVLSA